MLKLRHAGSFLTMISISAFSYIAHAQNFTGSMIMGGGAGIYSAISPLLSGTNYTGMASNGSGGNYPYVTTVPGAGGFGGFGGGGGGYGRGGYGQGGYQFGANVGNPWLAGGSPGFSPYNGQGGWGGGGGWGGSGQVNFGGYYSQYPFAYRNPGWPMSGYSPWAYPNMYAQNPALCQFCQACDDNSEHISYYDRGIDRTSYSDSSPRTEPTRTVLPTVPKPVVVEIPTITTTSTATIPTITLEPLPIHLGDGGGDYAPTQDKTCEEKRTNAFNKTEGGVCVGCLVKDPTVAGKAPLSEIKKIADRNIASLSTGAEDVMAVFYQDCRVITDDDVVLCSGDNLKGVLHQCEDKPCRRHVDPAQEAQYRESQPYLFNLCTSNGKVKAPIDNKCVDICGTKPLFNYGGKAYLENNEINVFHTGGGINKDGTGLDCSAFVSAAMTRMGLKASPTTSENQMSAVTTDTLMEAKAHPANSCFVTLDKSESPAEIKPGDVIAYKYGTATLGHAFIIDKVGNDPLGLEKMVEKKCADGSFSIAQLNFTIIQSAANSGGVGIQRIPASTYAKIGSFPVGQIEQMVKAECLAKLKNKPASSFITKDAPGKKPQFAIFRHKTAAEGTMGVTDKDAQACREPKHPLAHSECSNVRSCISEN